MSRVCHQAVSVADLSKGDVVFNAYEVPQHPRMHILTNGTLAYRPISSMVHDHTTVNRGAYISESVLWTEWIHRGKLTALTDSRITFLHVQEFQAVVMNFKNAAADPRNYGAMYVNALRTTSQTSSNCQRSS